MRALVYDETAGTPAVRLVPDPVCPADGVIIAVRATGVCRSDWHAWQGHDPVRLPHVGGHEFAGTVVEVGAEVRDWEYGDRVTTPFVNGCGHCAFCRSGDAQVCPDQTQPGFTGWGSFAELVAVAAADLNLVRLPERVDFAAAAALGCRFATAFRALTAHGRVSAGALVAIFGCGGAGLSAIMIATALGARVIAIDPAAPARELARSFGAELIIDPTTDDPVETIMELGGAEVTLDCAGTPATAVTAVRSLRRRGRHVQVGLLLGEQSTPPLPLDRVIAWELSVHGSHGMPAADYPAMIELITSGAVDPGLLITNRTDLAGAGVALQGMDRPGSHGITVADPSA
ncbi:zinc-dependent alcohol dehydrogenase family protein [Microlunatus speluncae]|uniref:zinc-dependent alcohol dehydrogenase family protein n=1 Tax=Microlunatus speluncae TaxID=2594267 RepID=UPI0012667125|nr:zinc-dependent alcohol dehydrogenase family protein [Microlunatus speluncae]